MKKLLILFSLNVLIGQVFAQHDYIPMAIEDAQWIYYNSDDDNLPPFIDYYFGYKIKGDIEIDNIWYKKVYFRRYTPVNNDGGPAVPPVYISTEVLFGAIRDDIPNKKVYGIVFDDNSGSGGCGIFDEEFLMYDFDMNVGDTFENFCLVGGGSSISLSNITEVALFDENRWLLQLVDGYPCCDWGYQLEGIGNYFPYGGAGYFGLFNPMGVPAGCPCTSFVEYCIGTDEECLDGFLNLDVENISINDFNIFPNPVEDRLHIESNNETTIKSVKIYSAYGKLILKVKYENEPIYISKISDGILFIKIETDNGRSIQKMIIKTTE